MVEGMSHPNIANKLTKRPPHTHTPTPPHQPNQPWMEQKTAWEYADKDGVAWDLVCIHPGLVFGPSLSGNEDSMSITLFKNLVTGAFCTYIRWRNQACLRMCTLPPRIPQHTCTQNMTGSPLVNLAWGIVDVRDVASAHVAAITNPRAQGRYIATSDTLSFLGIVDTVRHKVG